MNDINLQPQTQTEQKSAENITLVKKQNLKANDLVKLYKLTLAQAQKLIETYPNISTLPPEDIQKNNR